MLRVVSNPRCWHWEVLHNAYRACRARPRRACDCRGVLIAACVLVFLAVVGLSTWALVESITGIDQVSSFWSIEEALVEQVRGAGVVQRRMAYCQRKALMLWWRNS